jgi:AAA+ ATPase superfamily predicted ATPase
MISIKKNRSPILPQCKFLCDGKLDQKLDDYELTKFLNCHSTTLVFGKPRSGKTSLLYSLFKSKKLLKQCFENIFLFQPRHSRASMKDKLFDQLDENKKFDELIYDNLHYVAEIIKEEVEQEPEINNVTIFDDMGAYLRDNHVKQL